ncbi:MAG: ribonuclease HII, partial [bacterium]
MSQANNHLNQPSPEPASPEMNRQPKRGANRPNLNLEQEIRTAEHKTLIAGVDEAGRGAWAGPVVAGAVILPPLKEDFGINDSKQLLPLERERLFGKIRKIATAVGVGIVGVNEIDKMGVAQASYLAMQRAVDNLGVKPEHILVDGYQVNFVGVSSTGIIEGDTKSLSIAAASIIAKVARDKLMLEAHKKYSRFGFGVHKGYGTALHHERILKHGLCSLHRKSFAPIRAVLQNRHQQNTLD